MLCSLIFSYSLKCIALIVINSIFDYHYPSSNKKILQKCLTIFWDILGNVSHVTFSLQNDSLLLLHAKLSVPLVIESK